MEKKTSLTALPPELLDVYLKGFAEGFARGQQTESRPWLDHEGIMLRYGVGENKAREILQAIRRHCNGGLLNASGKVLLSEAVAWENNPEVKFKARL